MDANSTIRGEEPVIAVGLLDRCESARIWLQGSYKDHSGCSVPAGELRVRCNSGRLLCEGVSTGDVSSLHLVPTDFERCQFRLDMTIGIDFHWQQQESQSFRGSLQLVPKPDNRLTVINRVPLETYLTSVVCSEMKASAPTEFIGAHAVIARSWLLAQLVGRDVAGPRKAEAPVDVDGERLRWTDRQAHDDFDVCADDHCQRYQGISRINTPHVAAAVHKTRGEVLMYAGSPCDTRYSKSCGGVSEEFQTAWGDEAVPYLVAQCDCPEPNRKPPLLFDDASMRAFLRNPTPSYCDCHDTSILSSVLNDYDLTTADFFRWQVRLAADEASELVKRKLQLDLGRLLNLEPVERGPSGRLKRLRLVGEKRTMVIGKELEIRRALSESHLYSSAFVVDIEGPPQRPDAFVLTGAGWGHGVGLCQIGAAVMAHRAAAYREILAHYYPGTHVERLYP